LVCWVCEAKLDSRVIIRNLFSLTTESKRLFYVINLPQSNSVFLEVSLFFAEFAWCSSYNFCKIWRLLRFN